MTRFLLGFGLFSVALCAQAHLADSVEVYRSSDLDEVLVSVNRDTQKKLNTTQQTFTFSKSKIDFANKQNMADLLMESGQVAVQKSQQGGGSPILRGFEASRILLVVDGIRMNNLIYRNGHLQNSITVDQFAQNRVEVLNGPASLNYGTDGLGGAIVFNTQNPVLAAPGQRRFMTGNAAVRYGSANSEGSTHVDFNYGTEKFASLTSFTYSHFGDLNAGKNRNPFLPDDDAYIRCNYYVKPWGGKTDEAIANEAPEKQYRSGYDQYDILQKFLYQPNREEQHILNFQLSNTTDFNRYDRLSEMNTGEDGTVTPKFAEWYYGPQFRLLSAYHFHGWNKLGADKVNLTLAYQNVKESRHDRKFQKEDLYHNWEQVHMATLNTDWIKYWDQHTLHLGVDGMFSFLKSTAETENVVTGERSENGTRYPDGKNRMHTVEAFATHEWQVTPKVRMNDGVRLGYATTYSSVLDEEVFPFFAGKDQRKQNMTYSLAWGLNYLPAKTWKLAWSASTAYRVPNIDTASKVFESKTSTVTIPNENLKPEKTVTVDMNITKHIGDRLVWENVVYGTYYFDAITTARGLFKGEGQMEYQGTLCDVYTQVNAKAAVLWGFSSSLTAKPSRNLEFNATYNYTYGRVVKGEKHQPLDHIPPMFGRVGVAYLTSNGKGRFEAYSLYNSRKRASDYNADGEDNIKYATVKGADGEGMPAWFTLNLKGSYNVTSQVTLQAGVENLLDTEYRVFASGISAPGRNIFVAARVGF